MAYLNIINKFQTSMLDIQRQLNFRSGYRLFLDKILAAYSKDPIIFERDFQRLVRTFFPSEWQKFNTDFTRQYDNVVKIVNDLYKDLGADINRDFIAIKNIERINETRMGNFETQATRTIQKTIRRGLFLKVDLDKMEKLLLRNGIESYANTIARTQIKGYGRESKYTKANIGQVFYYEYVGQLRITTRPFCREMLGETLHLDEINELDNSFVSKTGKTYKQLQPVITYCGGWNCIHDWEPDPFYKPPKNKIRKNFIPAKTIEEAEKWAIDNGIAKNINYKNFTLELANKTNAQIYKRKKEFDITFDNIKILNSKKSTFYLETETRINHETFEKQSQSLIINKYKLKQLGNGSLDIADINKGIKNANNSGLWTSENYEQIIDHELGHYLTSTEADKNINIINKTVFPISIRATKDGYESLAEIFTLYMKSGKFGLTDEMLDFFNKYMEIKI